MVDQSNSTAPSILIVNGSPRRFGRTQAITRYAEEQFAAQGFAVHRIELADLGLPLYDGTPEQTALPSYVAWKNAVDAAQGLFIASPEYHNGMSGMLKNALDYLGGDQFRRKPTAIVAMAGGGKGGMNALGNMRIVLRGLYALVLPDQAVVDKDQIDASKTVADPQARKRLDIVIDELARVTRMMHPGN